tara:strand:- start:17 stop:517 length:501 start_codon:yes stop_codon:yes gene_type:complete
MIQWILNDVDYDAYLSTEDNRISTTSTKAQIAYLVKFINDLDGSIRYSYGYINDSNIDITDRYTKLQFYDTSGAPDIYVGDLNLRPTGHYKYEVYEVSWLSSSANVTLGTAPTTELDVLPVANTNGVVKGLVTKGILNVTEKAGTEQVQYTQHAEPDKTNYIYYGQ